MAGQVLLMRRSIALQVRQPSMPHSKALYFVACVAVGTPSFLLIDLHTARVPLTRERVMHLHACALDCTMILSIVHF